MPPKLGSFWLLSATLVAKVTGDSTCAPYPVSLKVGNVTLSNGQVARGVELGVGMPSQSMAFLPQWPLNNSFVYPTTGFCTAVLPTFTTAGCTTFRGGAYDPGSSTTQRGGAASAFAPDVPSAAGGGVSYPALTKISDRLILGAGGTGAWGGGGVGEGSGNVTTLAEFPLGIVLADWGEQGYHPQAALGLGANSTLLSALVRAGAIASRSWAWSWGSSSSSSSSLLDGPQQDGSLVLGGYDKARVAGSGYTQSMSSDTGRCASGLVVTLTDVVVHFTNGTTASMFPGEASAALAACLDPAYPTLMTIPLDPYWIAFESLTNASITNRSEGLNWYDMRYDAGEPPFDGNLSITFSSGLSLSVTNAQFISPDITIDQTTGALTTNSTRPVIAINALQDANAGDIITIGRNFFSAAYVMANYDTGLFTLWAAATGQDQPQTNLVAVNAAGAEIESFCVVGNGTATVTAGGAIADPTDNPTSTPAPNGSGSRVGRIAGGVVGSVVGIVVLSAVGLVLVKRGTASQGQRLADTELRDRNIDRTSLHMDGYLKTQKADLLSHSQQPDSPQELAALEPRGPYQKTPAEME